MKTQGKGGGIMADGAESYRRFLNGDREGMVELIRDYKDGLILYLGGIVGNIHTAEDIMEDTFVKLVVKKPKFREKCSFKTWLYTIGRNTALDYLRRNSKKSDKPLDELEIADKQDLELSYIQEERRIMVHRALADLKSDYAQVLYLSFFEELTNEEIAAVMHKTKRQVENLLYRAKLSLKNVLEKEGFSYEEL